MLFTIFIYIYYIYIYIYYIYIYIYVYVYIYIYIYIYIYSSGNVLQLNSTQCRKTVQGEKWKSASRFKFVNARNYIFDI